MKEKLFLGVQGLLFISYGLYCLVNPSSLLDSAGLMATTTTATIELQSMYGGLQTSIGVMCALALLQPRWRFPTLLALLFLFAGLAVVRVTLGLTQGDFSDYTSFAMIYESVSLLVLVWLTRSAQSTAGG